MTSAGYVSPDLNSKDPLYPARYPDRPTRSFPKGGYSGVRILSGRWRWRGVTYVDIEVVFMLQVVGSELSKAAMMSRLANAVDV